MLLFWSQSESANNDATGRDHADASLDVAISSTVEPPCKFTNHCSVPHLLIERNQSGSLNGGALADRCSYRLGRQRPIIIR